MRRSKRHTTGILRISRGGTAFVAPDDGGPEILLLRGPGHGALAGDRVEVAFGETKWGLRGRLVDVVEARTRAALGVVEKSGRGLRVVLDRREFPPWLNVKRSALGGAEVGDRVWVEILRRGSGEVTGNCVVDEVLGYADDPRTDFRAICLEHGLDEGFPDAAKVEAARAAGASISGSGRKDFRDDLLFTIDPADAKDHDDALSYLGVTGGRCQVGVHIADVSYYVRHGGALDVAARDRGTSVYLSDGALPMLPAILSENICSLVPEQDRYTLSVIFEMDRNGEVKRREFVRGIVRSKASLSYEGAEAYIEGEGGGDLGDALRALASLAAALAERRFRRGALDLDIPDAEIVFDEKGRPADVLREKRLVSHRIIEEFMLLANEAVAAEARKRKLPFVYRTHPAPKAEKLDKLSDSLGELGVRFSPGSVAKSSDLGKPLRKISDERRRALGAYLVLRAMQRARYAPSAGLHFGLASSCYCHFTSPIRRYPDLYDHRALRGTVFDDRRREGGAGPPERGGKDTRDRERWNPARIAESSSETEERADAAERDSIKVKCIRFMEGKLGETFTGIVTAVMERGYAVELDRYPIEGFAGKPLYRRSGGRRGGFFLGDRVTVRVSRADPYQKELELAVVKKDKEDTDKR